MWVLGKAAGSSKRTASALVHWTTPSSSFDFFTNPYALWILIFQNPFHLPCPGFPLSVCDWLAYSLPTVRTEYHCTAVACSANSYRLINEQLVVMGASAATSLKSGGCWDHAQLLSMQMEFPVHWRSERIHWERGTRGKGEKEKGGGGERESNQ